MKKQMKLMIVSTIMCLYPFLGKAQNPVWSINSSPWKYRQSGSPLTTSPYSVSPAIYGTNAMTDVNGNLLFFVVDDIVYKKDGDMLAWLNLPKPMAPSPELAIVPKPGAGNCNKYYLFYGLGYGAMGITEPYYSELDITVGGDINCVNMKTMTGDINIWERSRVAFAASKIRPDGSRFLFVYNGIGNVYRFKVSSSGITYDSYVHTVPSPVSSSSASQHAEFEMYENTDGTYKLALSYKPSSGPIAGAVYYMNFSATNVLTSSGQYNFPAATVGEQISVSGLEFSPNGSYLYVTHSTSASNLEPIQYINLSTNIAGSISVTGKNDFQSSYIELHKDGKLYLATSNRLATITNPNSPPGTWNNTAVTVASTAIAHPGSVPSPIYVLPDQIDGMDYSLHFFGGFDCCKANTAYTQNSYTATTNATWQPGTGTANPFTGTIGTGSVVTIRDELRIPAGKTITIKNMTFRFAPGAKVIVERGSTSPNLPSGRLLLNNTTFTVDERCGTDKMWQGVEVWGYYNMEQDIVNTGSNKQGYFQMQNGSIIEHAYTGVVAGRKTSSSASPSYDGNYGGGIIYTENSTFRHNRTDVYIFGYVAPSGNDNYSQFSKTNFLLNGKLKDLSLTPNYRVQLQSVKGVKLRGCTIENQDLVAYTQANAGYGVYSSNATAHLLGSCSLSFGFTCYAYDFSLVKGFDIGFYAIGLFGDPSRTYLISRTNFVNNNVGLSSVFMQNPVCVLNDFTVRSDYPESYGIQLLANTGYKVEENNFHKMTTGTPTPGTKSYGILVQNAHELNTQIYKNTFTDLNIGIQAMGINGKNYLDGNIAGGLKLKCNTFVSNIYEADIAVTGDGSATPGRIDYEQGLYGNYVIGNVFSHSTNTSYNDIWMNPGVIPISYVYNPTTPHTPLYYSPTYVGLLADPFTAVSCPSNTADYMIAVNTDSKLQQWDELEFSEKSQGNNGTPLNDLQKKRESIISEILQEAIEKGNYSEVAPLLKERLSKIDDKDCKLKLVGIYLGEGDFASAEKVLNAIKTKYPYDNKNILAETFLGMARNNSYIPEQLDRKWNEDDAFASSIMLLKNALGANLDGKGYSILAEPLYAEYSANSAANISEEKISGFSLFPNPANQTITISFEGITATDIEITSMTGQTISGYPLGNASRTFTVDISSLPAGIYIVKLKHADKLMKQTKFVKQ